jgi:hypothetical protein
LITKASVVLPVHAILLKGKPWKRYEVHGFTVTWKKWMGGVGDHATLRRVQICNSS